MNGAAPEETPIRVLLVDDEALVRAGLRMILSTAPDLAVVGEAEDGIGALERTRELTPDVVLLDIRMPAMDGLRALELMRALPDPPHVIVLTTFDADDHVYDALASGAAGFLLKDTPPRALIQAIRTTVTGGAILSPDLTRRIAARHTADVPDDVRARLATLSERELEILPLVAQGLSNAEIGRDLYLSEATVKAHLTHILAKLGTANRVQVAVLAVRAGLLPDD
ncbi:response regulator [Nocardioides sp. T2.26MG-1]|uniref:response regulator n=1 Tax=Nocardioides sp. T2.26MG-1 TaxID=3041166 RepID=UPI002477377F|nr:response regulator transcription factor [Nocardioides sp. T2.26MG-1]CAI9408057.1 Transcriptional regulatory protein LiaR [Nocardioides sp. T2.26MG-1]